MASGIASLDARRPAVAARQLIPSAVLGMLLFVFTEAMLFAGLISAHAIAKAGAPQWPPPDQPRLPQLATLLNTAALLFSGGALIIAHLAFRTKARQARTPLLVAVLAGAFFVIFQGREWVALIAQGLTMTSSPFGSFFYLIVGTHALHAVAAMLGLVWAWRRLGAGRLTLTQLGAVETFWYFVVLVWPILYVRVYL